MSVLLLDHGLQCKGIFSASRSNRLCINEYIFFYWNSVQAFLLVFCYAALLSWFWVPYLIFLSKPRQDSDVLLLHLTVNFRCLCGHTGYFMFQYGVKRAEECLECSQNQESRRWRGHGLISLWLTYNIGKMIKLQEFLGGQMGITFFWLLFWDCFCLLSILELMFSNFLCEDDWNFQDWISIQCYVIYKNNYKLIILTANIFLAMFLHLGTFPLSTLPGE